MATHINTVLKSKALQARERLSKKREMDRMCVYNQVLSHKTFKVMSALQYIRGFLDDENIDKPVTFEEIDVDWRKVHANEYVYDSEKDHALEARDEWLRKQNNYITSLTKEQIFNLYAYTYKGDELVNSYLRNEMTEDDFEEHLEKFKWHNIFYFPLFFPALRVFERYSHDSLQLLFSEKMAESDVHHATIIIDKQSLLSQKYKSLSKIAKKLSFNRFWVSCLDVYAESIGEIIKSAPLTENTFVLYRGSFTDHFLRKYINDTSNKLHISKGFMSCSSSIHVATQFTSFDCCFVRIMIPVKTKLLLLAGVSRFEESEFLMDTNTQFYITKSRIERFCKDNTSVQTMRVSNMVVIM